MIGQTPVATGALDVDAIPDGVLADAVPPSAAAPPCLDPTRYGDWERNGRCIDF